MTHCTHQEHWTQQGTLLAPPPTSGEAKGPFPSGVSPTSGCAPGSCSLLVSCCCRGWRKTPILRVPRESQGYGLCEITFYEYRRCSPSRVTSRTTTSSPCLIYPPTCPLLQAHLLTGDRLARLTGPRSSCLTPSCQVSVKASLLLLQYQREPHGFLGL
jgi:hypothetical protein